MGAISMEGYREVTTVLADTGVMGDDDESGNSSQRGGVGNYMADVVGRDKIWSATMQLLGEGHAQIRRETVLDLVDDPPSPATITRSFRAMVAMGWLAKDNDSAKLYLPGRKARKYFEYPSGTPKSLNEIAEEADERQSDGSE